MAWCKTNLSIQVSIDVYIEFYFKKLDSIFFESMWHLFNLFLVLSFSFNFLRFLQFMSWFYVCPSSHSPLTLERLPFIINLFFPIFFFVAQEFYLPMQSGGILNPENLSAIFLNLQVTQISFTNLSISNSKPTNFPCFLARLSRSETENTEISVRTFRRLTI